MFPKSTFTIKPIKKSFIIIYLDPKTPPTLGASSQRHSKESLRSTSKKKVENSSPIHFSQGSAILLLSTHKIEGRSLSFRYMCFPLFGQEGYKGLQWVGKHYISTQIYGLNEGLKLVCGWEHKHKL